MSDEYEKILRKKFHGHKSSHKNKTGQEILDDWELSQPPEFKSLDEERQLDVFVLHYTIDDDEKEYDELVKKLWNMYIKRKKVEEQERKEKIRRLRSMRFQELRF